MSRLVLWNLVTLEGFFEGPKAWDLEWHNLVWGEELEELSIAQLRSAGRLLFGRLTYEGMARYWSTAEGEVAQLMNSVPKVVFSTSLARANWNNTHLINSEAAQEVARLKSETDNDMYLFGSAVLASSLTKSRLIDEYRLCVVPVVLGSGTPLFKPGVEVPTMRLLEARALQTGAVILRYETSRGHESGAWQLAGALEKLQETCPDCRPSRPGGPGLRGPNGVLGLRRTPRNGANRRKTCYSAR